MLESAVRGLFQVFILQFLLPETMCKSHLSTYLYLVHFVITTAFVFFDYFIWTRLWSCLYSYYFVSARMQVHIFLLFTTGEVR